MSTIVSMDQKQVITLTGVTDDAVSEIGGPSNIVIDFNSGSGTITHTMTGTTTPITDPTTIGDSYKTTVLDNTFTLSAGTAADVTITIEPQ